MIKIKSKNLVAYFANASAAADGLRDHAAFSDNDIEILTVDTVHSTFLNNAEYIIDTVNDVVIKNRNDIDLEELFDTYLGISDND